MKNDYKKMDKAALLSSLEPLQKELSKLNTQRSTGSKLENPGNVKKIRRNIARIYTEIKIKTQGGAIRKK